MQSIVLTRRSNVMPLKNTIQHVYYINILLFLILGITIANFLFWRDQIFQMPLGSGLLMAGIVLFFIRKTLLSRAMATSDYPGVLWNVMKKMKLVVKIDPKPADDLLEEVRRPHYTTSQFLQDNNLHTEINDVPLRPYVVWMFVAGLVILETYLFQKYTFQERPFVYIILPALTVAQFFIWKKTKRRRTDGLRIKFTDQGLWLRGEGTIPWKKIYAWEYISGGKNSQARININSYNEGGEIRETPLLLDGLSAGRIELLLLFTHYTGRYGGDGPAD